MGADRVDRQWWKNVGDAELSGLSTKLSTNRSHTVPLLLRPNV